MFEARCSSVLAVAAGSALFAPSAFAAVSFGAVPPVEARLSVSTAELSGAPGETVSVTVFAEADTDVFSPGNGLAAFEFEVGGIVDLAGNTASGDFQSVSVDRENGVAGTVGLLAPIGAIPNIPPGPYRVELASVDLLIPEGTALGAYSISFSDIASLDGVQGSFDFFALHDGRQVAVSETGLRLLVVPAPGATMALAGVLGLRRRR